MDIKKIFFACAAALLLIMPSAAVFADAEVTVLLDGRRMEFDTEPIIINSRTMVPMRAIFEACGAEVLWDGDTERITAICDDTVLGLEIDSRVMTKNDIVTELDAPPMLCDDRTLVPLRAVTEAFGCLVEWYDPGRIVSIFSPVESGGVMDGMSVTDQYRYSGYDGEFNGVSVFNRDSSDYFGMELLRISPDRGEEYAGIVNAMAEQLPDVRVFCGVVPTAAEFYADLPHRTNYLSAISHIYNALDERVTPLNIEAALMNNADRYIYFRTDHHWTQLGAYCAYREFCSAAELEAPPLESFEMKTIGDYLGSWGKVTVDTDGYSLLDSSRDSIEIYMPSVGYEAAAYRDMALQEQECDIQLINEAFGSYTAFICGDNPIVHISTDCGSGRRAVLIKESYGNAFSTWLVNNYTDIYVVDYRLLNGNNDNSHSFDVREFYNLHPYDDLIVLSYPYTIAADDLRGMLGQLVDKGVID